MLTLRFVIFNGNILFSAQIQSVYRYIYICANKKYLMDVYALMSVKQECNYCYCGKYVQTNALFRPTKFCFIYLLLVQCVLIVRYFQLNIAEWNSVLFASW